MATYVLIPGAGGVARYFSRLVPLLERGGHRAIAVDLPGQWWDAVGSGAARVAAAEQRSYPVEFDLETYFLHDVDPAVAAEGEPYQRPEADAVFESVCDFDHWPDVPITCYPAAV